MSNGPKEIVWIGRPRKFTGYREQAGGLHLGRGIWMLRYVREDGDAARPADGAAGQAD